MYSATIDREKLAAALSAFKGLVRRNPNFPILESIQINAKPQFIEIIGTNFDQTMSRTVPVAGSGEASFAVHFERAARFIEAAISSEATIAFEDKTVTFRAGRSRASLPTLNPDIPIPEPLELPSKFTIETSELARAWRFCGSAVSSEETRYYLLGIYLDTMNETPVAVATDGRVLSLTKISISGDLERKPIIPSAFFPLACNSGTETLEIAASDTAITASWEMGFIRSKLIDGTYPDWQRMLSRHTAQASVACKRSELTEAARRTLAASDSNILGFLANSSLRMRSHNGGPNPDSEDEIDCGLESQNMSETFGVDGRHLISSLDAFKPHGDDLKIAMSSANGLLLSVGGSDDLRLVMAYAARFYPEARE